MKLSAMKNKLFQERNQKKKRKSSDANKQILLCPPTKNLRQRNFTKRTSEITVHNLLSGYYKIVQNLILVN